MKNYNKLLVSVVVFFACAITIRFLPKESGVAAVFGLVGAIGLGLGLKEIQKQFHIWKQEEEEIERKNKEEKDKFIKSTFVNFKKI